jgi:hypothetical protein
LLRHYFLVREDEMANLQGKSEFRQRSSRTDGGIRSPFTGVPH